MALFINSGRRARRQQKTNLRRLDVLCCKTAKHPLPVKMKCIGQSASRQGQPMAVYACPFAGCQWREGWVESRSGKPKRLWGGRHRRSGRK